MVAPRSSIKQHGSLIGQGREAAVFNHAGRSLATDYGIIEKLKLGRVIAGMNIAK
jgi:hypothetical protein